jgi:hypothetical protein
METSVKTSKKVSKKDILKMKIFFALIAITVFAVFALTLGLKEL